MVKFRNAVISVIVFKCMKGLASSYLCDKFKNEIIHDTRTFSVNTRHKNIPLHNSTNVSCSSSVCNELSDIKDIETVGHFESEYKRALLHEFLRLM